MREKLIELLETVVSPKEVLCDGEVLVSTAKVADHLIANGVTFATDNNVGDKLTPTAKDTNVPSKWIPVTERLPERNAEVLVCDTREDYVSIWEHIGDGLWFGNEVIWATEDITHWMPLPEPPKEVE